jgi:hypothetical protein
MPHASETFSVPSKYIPIVAEVIAITTILACVVMNRLGNKDIGGLYWPYLSDAAKNPPEAAIFAFGLTITCMLLVMCVVINYGYIKKNIESRGEHTELGKKGTKRNKFALWCGLLSAPFLGLLAAFDTARTPALHIAFVLGFFPLVSAFLFVNTSTYALVLQHAHATRHARLDVVQKSVRRKRMCCIALLVFVTLYLPVGMSIVTSWVDYSTEPGLHSFRAVCQHLSILCLLIYFGSFYYDFGDLRLRIMQEDPPKPHAATFNKTS